MKTVELLNDPVCLELIKKGVISSKYSYYIEIYKEYKKNMAVCKSERQAILATAAKSNVVQSTVYKIVKSLDS